MTFTSMESSLEFLRKRLGFFLHDFQGAAVLLSRRKVVERFDHKQKLFPLSFWLRAIRAQKAVFRQVFLSRKALERNQGVGALPAFFSRLEFSCFSVRRERALKAGVDFRRSLDRKCFQPQFL